MGGKKKVKQYIFFILGHTAVIFSSIIWKINNEDEVLVL